MSIQQLNTPAKTAISLFLLFVITATLSSVILLGLELSGEKAGLNIPTISQIENKYTMPSIVSAMKGSMYKEVTDDSDIDTVHNWIKDGAKKEGKLYDDAWKIIQNDCANCHSKTSKMSRAIPSMPFDTYEQVLTHTEAGYSWSKMSKQAPDATAKPKTSKPTPAASTGPYSRCVLRRISERGKGCAASSAGVG